MAVRFRGEAWHAVVTAIAMILQAGLHPLAAQTARLTMQGPAENAATAPIRDSLGRTCLDVEAAARAQVVNTEMIDHVISFKNECTKLLKLKVCYFNSENCREVEVPPHKRVDAILGSMRGSNYFRYTIKQK